MPKKTAPADDQDVLLIDESNLDVDLQPGEPLPPNRLTDSELKDRLNKKGELHKQMCDLQNQLDQGGENAAEIEKQWDEMAAEYDDNDRHIQAHNTWARRREERQARLDRQMESNNRLPREIRDQLRFGGHENRDYDDDERDHVNYNPKIDAAVKAWMKGRAGKMSAITQDEWNAAKEIGFHPGDDQMRIPMLDNEAFQIAREEFLAAMEGLNPGTPGYEKARKQARKNIQNALSTTTGTGPNVLFGTSFITTLEEAVLAYGGVLSNCDIIRTEHGNPIYMPTGNDTANNGRMLTEALALPPAGTAVVGYADPTFANMVLYAFIGTSDAIAISNSLLEDNSIGLARRLPQMLGVRIGRLKNRKATLGAGVGSSEPSGVVVQSTLGKTAASAAAIVLDEIMDLSHTLDPELRNMHELKFMFHDSTLKLLRKLKDSEGRYLWQIDARSGAPDTLDGSGYIINQNMPLAATGQKSVLFGNFMAYKWREVVGAGSDGGIRMRVLKELYAENDQTAYMAFCRFDGRLLNPGDNPIVHLIHP